jgi:hypothetical protein
MKLLVETLKSLVEPVGILGAGLLVGLVVQIVLFRSADRLSGSTETILDDLLVKHCRGPARLR